MKLARLLWSAAAVLGAVPLAQVRATPVVAATGDVRSFGTAQPRGSTGRLNKPVVDCDIPLAGVVAI